MERPEPETGTPELEQCADGFVAWLGRLGYSPRTCEAQVALLRHLARWLAERGVPLSGLSSEVAGEYAAVRAGTVAAAVRTRAPAGAELLAGAGCRPGGRGRRAARACGRAAGAVRGMVVP